MIISAILAMGRERQIGLKGKLPWSLPQEYQHYLDTTKNQVCLLGRKNFELEYQDFSDRTAIVLTRQKNYTRSKYVAHSPEEALKIAQSLDAQEVFVCGGGEIYQEFWSRLDRLYLSVVDYYGPADAFAPEVDFQEWNLLKERVVDAGEKNAYFWHYRLLERKV